MDKNIDNFTTDAIYISDALLGIDDFVTFCSSSGGLTLEDSNKLNGLLVAVSCLAKQHAQDIEKTKEGRELNV